MAHKFIIPKFPTRVHGVDDVPSSIRSRYQAPGRPSSHRRRTLSARALESKAETRRSLLEAGANQFREFGFDRPSLDSICSEAGYTRGAFYVHFGTRENLICAVAEAEIERAQRQITYCTEPQETLETLFERMFADADSLLSTSQRLDAAARFPELGQLQAESLAVCVRYVSNVLQASARDGSVRADLDFETVAYALLALAQGEMLLREIGIMQDQDELTASIRKLLGK
ncbi:MAG: TetR/AcrR family transcriptional regulator [Polyangiaceae bacterium]|nr:TetR/AcrR family transcriptional regulator [Polyangiaceae bacterium]MCW5790044.1 TetR/AcrR family transcriptional regulator [Polyangiaceae bacterium]